MATFIIDKNRGPKDVDDLWQLFLSMKLRALHSVVSGSISESSNPARVSHGLSEFTFRVNGMNVLSPGAPTIIWDFTTQPNVPAGHNQAFWILVDAALNPVILPGTAVAVDADDSNALHFLPDVDLETYSIAGVYEGFNGVDLTGTMNNIQGPGLGEVYTGIPEGACIGMENRYFVNNPWIDVHLN